MEITEYNAINYAKRLQFPLLPKCFLSKASPNRANEISRATRKTGPPLNGDGKSVWDLLNFQIALWENHHHLI